MNNEHIALVKKWLADNDSVSQAELDVNSYAAGLAVEAAYAAKGFAAAAAKIAATAADAADYWVKAYERLSDD